MAAIKKAGLKICADAMGGSGLRYWQPIAERYGLDITIRNAAVDYTFSFMTVDHRRQSPHGLFLTLCHGESGRSER